MIWKVFRPLVGFKKRIELIETEANEMQILIGQLMETNKVQNKALLAIINHMIDGNSVERLKETRDHMQSEMIET